MRILGKYTRKSSALYDAVGNAFQAVAAFFVAQRGISERAHG